MLPRIPIRIPVIVKGQTADYDSSKNVNKTAFYILDCFVNLLKNSIKMTAQGDKRLLNTCIMAHIDHGKTTFADGLLSVNSIVPR